jgi:tetratricopeptide (TPR) repeat protein
MPESNAATTNLGSAYFLLGRFEDAASAWEDALSGAPTSTLYSNPGSSYFFLGRFGEAAETYQKSLALAPEGFEGWGNLADAYKHSPTQSDMAVPNYRRAIALAEQHLKINPSDAVAIAALAHYQACVGKREEALENVNLAKKLAQKDMYIYYFSATALSALNEQAAALDAVREAISLGYPPHMVEVDAGLSSLKDLPEFAAVLSENIEKKP